MNRVYRFAMDSKESIEPASCIRIIILDTLFLHHINAE